MGNVYKEKTKPKHDEAEVETEAVPDQRDQTLGDDVDDILDEIDLVLEEDAQTFVSQYIQKGGE